MKQIPCGDDRKKGKCKSKCKGKSKCKAKSKCKGKSKCKYRGLSATAAKGAASGRDDNFKVVGFCNLL
jgi:hypothetical protein